MPALPPPRAFKRAVLLAASCAMVLPLTAPAHADEAPGGPGSGGPAPSVGANLSPGVYGETRVLETPATGTPSDVVYFVPPGQSACLDATPSFVDRGSEGAFYVTEVPLVAAGKCLVSKRDGAGDVVGRVAITVKPAPLTVTVDPSSRHTGQDDPDFTTTVTGWTNGDEPTTLAGNPTFTALLSRKASDGTVVKTPSSPASPRGKYNVRAAGYVDPANYRIKYKPGTMTVTKAPVTTVTTFTATNVRSSGFNNDYSVADLAYTGYTPGATYTIASSGMYCNDSNESVIPCDVPFTAGPNGSIDTTTTMPGGFQLTQQCGFFAPSSVTITLRDAAGSEVRSDTIDVPFTNCSNNPGPGPIVVPPGFDPVS